MRLTDLMSLSHVPRWSIVRHHRGQSVADHSYRVAVIYLELCSRLGKDPSLRGLTHALYHDGPESRSGDIPGLFKRHIKEQVQQYEAEFCPWHKEDVPPQDRDLIKIADKIEAWTYIKMEGYGDHADMVTRIIWEELKAVIAAFPDDIYDVVRLIAVDITTERERL